MFKLFEQGIMIGMGLYFLLSFLGYGFFASINFLKKGG